MQDIYSVLNQFNISYIEHNHPPVYTCEDADKYFGFIQGGKTKNLFLRNKKGDRHFLVTMYHAKTLDLKQFGDMLGVGRLSFASPERLQKYLGVQRGLVGPFALINDIDKEVEVFVDKDLLKYEKVFFHPNINTSTLEISKDDFIVFMDYIRRDYKLINI